MKRTIGLSMAAFREVVEAVEKLEAVERERGEDYGRFIAGDAPIPLAIDMTDIHIELATERETRTAGVHPAHTTIRPKR